jgi:hypothetical protein
MRLFSLLILVGVCTLANAQNIATKALSPGVPIKIVLSPALTTTLLFPGPLSGTFGLGLVPGNNAQAASNGGTVQVEHPDGSNVLVLHALSESAHVLATILLDGALYVLDLECGSTPDVAVTLVKSNSPTVQGQGQTVTPEQVRLARPKYDPEILVGLLRRAHDAQLLKSLYPDLYKNYASRDAKITTDSGNVKTTVTRIHRFGVEDAIVLQGTVENETTRPISFDGRSATVQVANEVHPIKLLDCLRPIPPNTTVPIDVVIQGDIDGGRANLAINNEYRIMLPPPDGMATLWDFKNGGATQFSITPNSIVKTSGAVIPVTQTGRPKKEDP